MAIPQGRYTKEIEGPSAIRNKQNAYNTNPANFDEEQLARMITAAKKEEAIAAAIDAGEDPEEIRQRILLGQTYEEEQSAYAGKEMDQSGENIVPVGQGSNQSELDIQDNNEVRPGPDYGGSGVNTNARGEADSEEELAAYNPEAYNQEGLGSLSREVPEGRNFAEIKAFDPDEVIIENNQRVPVEEMRKRYNETVAYQKQTQAERTIDIENMTPDRESFINAYQLNMAEGSPQLQEVYVMANKVADAVQGLAIKVTTPDDVENLGTGNDVSELLKTQFNTSPMAAVVAATEVFALFSAALSSYKTSGEKSNSFEEDEFRIEELLAHKEVIYNPSQAGGLVGIEKEAFYRIMFAAVNQRIRASSQTTGNQSEVASVGGKLVTALMEQAGYVTEEDYQPLDQYTLSKKGPMQRAIMLTHEGMVAGDNLKGFKGQENIRAQAASVSAGTNKTIANATANRETAYRGGTRKKDDVFVITKGEVLQQDMANHASNATKTFDPESFDFYQLLLSALANGELSSDAEGRAESIFVKEFSKIGQKILKIKPKQKIGLDGTSLYDVPVSDSQKFKTAMRQIRKGRALVQRTTTGYAKYNSDGTPVLSSAISSHKTASFYDRATGRVYYLVEDSNGQESRTHRGILTGMKSDVNISLLPKVLNNLPVVKKSQFDSFTNWLNGSQSNTTTRYVSYMIALGNLLVRGSRDISNEATLKLLTGDVINQAANKGRSIRKFLAMNAEHQAALLEDVKLGIIVEGLTPVEQGDILNVLNEIVDCGNAKEAGAQIRAYTVAATLEDALISGKSTVFIALPTAADMKSAGRMFAAADRLDHHTVSRVGMAFNEVAGMVLGERDLHNAFPVGNPRMFFTDALVASMKDAKQHPKGVEGYIEFDSTFSNSVAVYLQQMLNKQGPTFSDMAAKLILMVADYGKASSQNQTEVSAFFDEARKEHPEIFYYMEDSFYKQGLPDGSMLRFFEEAMWKTTVKIVGTANSRTIKSMAESMALSNIQPHFKAYGDRKMVVGSGVQRVIPGATLEIQVKESGEVRKYQLQEREYTDNPTAATPGRMLENGIDYYQAGVASAAVNAIGAFMGHSRESTSMILALNKVIERLGEGIFLDQVYDSISLEPEAAMLYEHYLNEYALFEVLENNDAYQFFKTWRNEMYRVKNEVVKAGTITLGPEGEYHGWSTKLDEEWASLIRETPIEKIKNDAFQERILIAEKKIAKKLKEAQDQGIWSPIPFDIKGKGGEKISKLGFDFVTRSPNQKVYEVSGTKFAVWLERNVISDIDKNGTKLFRPNDSKELRKFFAKMKAVKTKAFQKGGLPPVYESIEDSIRYNSDFSAIGGILEDYHNP